MKTMKTMKFTLEIEIATDGETEDAVYRWLCNQLFYIDGITGVTEVETK